MQEQLSASERLKALTDRLEQGVSDIFQSGQYAAYLTAMSKFHHYSFGNAMLIFMQCPNASHVAGYHDWKRKFGRQVKRGEHGITILAPCPYRRREEVEETAPPGRLYGCDPPMGAARRFSDSHRVRCEPDRGKAAAGACSQADRRCGGLRTHNRGDQSPLTLSHQH